MLHFYCCLAMHLFKPTGMWTHIQSDLGIIVSTLAGTLSGHGLKLTINVYKTRKQRTKELCHTSKHNSRKES